MLTSARGYSLNPRQPQFEALVIENGRIVDLGSQEDIMLQYRNRVNRVMDVGGAVVLPGLVDSHLHLSLVGEYALRLDLGDVRTKEEMLHRIRTKAASLAPHEWVLGGGWDDNKMLDGEVPNLEQLDEASGGRPLLLTRICQHVYLANSQALIAAGLGLNPTDPADGRFGRDTHGQLTGLVYEHAVRPLLLAVPRRTEQEQRAVLRLAMEAALRQGITAVHTDDTRVLGGFASTWKTFYQLIHEEHVHLRVHELVDYAYLPEYVELLPELPTLPGWLEAGAVKMFSDGSFGGRTAWLSEPYTDAPGWFGTPILAQDELNERVRMAHRQGVSVAIHAIGDRALDAVLTALEGAPKIDTGAKGNQIGAGAKRDRIVHAELVRPDLLSRMQQLGASLAVDVQPRFTVSDFPWVAERVGEKRTPFINALRKMKNAGLHLCGGSDAPIEPVSPLLGLHAAVTRRKPGVNGQAGLRKSGSLGHEDLGYEMQECLSRLEALRLFGQDACFANGTEQEKGVLAPGWFADLTILDCDVLAAEDPDELLRAEVLYTIVGGKIAYSKDGSKDQEGA